MTNTEIIDLTVKVVIGVIGGVSGYLLREVDSLKKRTTIIETRDEAKIAALNELKSDIKSMSNDIKTLQTYVHENVHKQNNKDSYLNPMIQKIYEIIIKNPDKF